MTDSNALAAIFTYGASAIVTVLSLYVIYVHVKRYQADVRRLLPLHVWLIAISYLLIIAGGVLLQDDIEFDLAFSLYFPGLCIGVYSMLVLATHQQQTKNEHR